MKLHWSPRSPFVRKVMIVAHELGLDRPYHLRAHRWRRPPDPHAPLMAENPLSKIPTLVLDDGTVLYDLAGHLRISGSACTQGAKLVPADGKERMTALRRQALGDGFLDFLLLLRNERERAHPSDGPRRDLRYQEAGRARVARQRGSGDLAASAFTIGHIAIGCALSYLDFRFARRGLARAATPASRAGIADFCATPLGARHGVGR